MASGSKIKGFDADESVSPRPSGSRSPSGPDTSNAKGKGRAVAESVDADDELDEDTCAICLAAEIRTQAEAAPCGHNLFCFACLSTWCEMSRRCPLCNTHVELIKTHVRSETDYQKHHLLPLASSGSSKPRRPSDPPIFPAAADIDMAARRQLFNRPSQPRHRRHEWGKSRNRRVELDELEEEELALQRRKWIYKHKLFAKHVASNAYTRYQSFTPAQFGNSAERKARVVKFARRELQVFPNVDVEWLVTYLLQIMCQLDLRSDNAIRLLSEFLGWDQAEHFAHEVLTFTRSPYNDLKHWDQITQYDRPECSPPPAPPAPLPPARRPLSPEPYNDRHSFKKRRSSDHGPARGADTYRPGYDRRGRSPSPPYRAQSPPRRRDFSSPRSRPPYRSRSRSRERRPSYNEPPRYQNGRDRSLSPMRDVPAPAAALSDDEEPPVPFEPTTPPLPDRPLPGVEKGISLRGLANVKAKRASLQERLEAEKVEAAKRTAADAERRKTQLAEKLRKEKAEALKQKLLARLEEEKARAEQEASETAGRSGAYGGGTSWQNEQWDFEATDEEEEASGYDREEELRRALAARMAVGKRRIDPKARLLAEMSAVEQRLAKLRQELGR